MWDLQLFREVTGCRTPGDHASRCCDEQIARGVTFTRSASRRSAAGRRGRHEIVKTQTQGARHAASHHDGSGSSVVMAATSAKAEYNYGPLKKGTQCYKMSANGWNNQGYGYWASCPNPAAPTANPNRSVHHHETHQSKRS
jgi:hypothetical protein